MADGQVVFEISADGKKAYAAIDDVTEALSKAGKKWESSATQSTDAIGNKFTSMFKKIGVAALAMKAGKALLDLGKSAIEAASDLQEVQNVVDVTFGAGANQIEAWAKTAGEQFGLTELQAKRFTSTLGAMMKSSGLAGDEIIGMSTDLAGLAADMASFYNLDFDTAFQKIRSGISGETEPLKQLGINMSVVNLEAYAMTQGITKSFNEMSQGEQTMLRYQYLMQATADAQGDFARTSSTSFANMKRQLQTNLETISASIGSYLIGPVQEATAAIAGFLSELTKDKPRTVLDEFADINLNTEGKLAEINNTAEQARLLTGILEEIAGKTITYGEDGTRTSLISALSADLGGLDQAVADAANIPGDLAEIAKGLNPDTPTDKITKGLGGIDAGITGLESTVAGASGLPDNLSDLAGKLSPTISDGFQTGVGGISEKIGKLDQSVKDASGLKDGIAGIAGAITGLPDNNTKSEALHGIAISANELGVLTGPKWQAFANALGDIGADAGDTLYGVAAALSENVGGDADKWANILQAIGNNASAALAAVGDNDGSATKAFLENVAAGADDLQTDYSSYWNNLLSVLGDNAGDAISALAGGDTAGGALATIAEGANDLGVLAGSKWQGFIDALGGLSGKSDIPGTLSGVAGALAENIGGKAGDWEKLLKAVGENLGKVTTAAETDAGKTAEFLAAAAAAADDLGGDYSQLWSDLLTTLGDDAPAAVLALKDATNTGSNLTSIANGANSISDAKAAIWRTLLGTLSSIDGLKNIFDSTAAGNVRDLAEALSNNSPETSQAEAWRIFFGALQANPDALTTLTQTSAEETAGWLSTMAEAVNKIDPTDAQAWSGLFANFMAGLPGLNDTEGGHAFFQTIASEFLAMGNQSDTARAGLAALGLSTEDIDTAQKDWLTTCQRLVKTLPGLSSIIDTQTGEVKGGADAVKEYIGEWQAAQEKAAMWAAYDEKRSALNQRFADLPGLKLDMAVAKRRYRQALEDAKEIYKQYGASLGRDAETGLYKGDWKFVYGLQAEQIEELEAALELLNKAQADYEKKMDAYSEEYNLAVEAEESLNELQETMVESYGELSDATDDAARSMTLLEKAANDDADAMTQVESAVKAASDALQDLADYQEKIRQETEQTVQSVVKGFDKVETPMMKARNELASLKQAWKDAGTAEEKAAALEKWEQAKNKYSTDHVTIHSMTEGLRSQLTFMQQYQAMLTQARANGVSEDILATLSDGSQESFDYLYALTQYSGNIDELNEMYAQVQKEAEGFTNTLTDQKLAVDEEYKSLLALAQEAVDGLNLSEEAYTGVSDTLDAILKACGDKSEAIQTAVDNIVSQMDRLSNLGAGGFFNGLGKLVFRNNSFFSYGSQANGMDYVPYDGYLALLHQGERIQTAAEADLSRRYSYTQPSIDYTAMGGAIGANIGRGNVYLDGRVVGELMSARQANSYRALERSGWQG